MVLGYHLIWTLYGWWLPNDPRGSMSKFIASDLIAELGKLHYGRKRVQPTGREIRQFYMAAADKLKHELSELSDNQFSVVAHAFTEIVKAERYTCYACAIMPDHVHLVIRKHRDQAEQMIAKFQEASRCALIAIGARPPHHPVWGGPGWKVYLDSPGDIQRTIPYIERNPVKIGLPLQRWSFITPYNGWPFHKKMARPK